MFKHLLHLYIAKGTEITVDRTMSESDSSALYTHVLSFQDADKKIATATYNLKFMLLKHSSCIS